ncbi:unnamed protein product [Linum trigynum]|uniref:Uncharacterized protein n=1 Tax=Linum trigynum TaxID=586398 RepID=A0AAV2C9W2_9ROSI
MEETGKCLMEKGGSLGFLRVESTFLETTMEKKRRRILGFKLLPFFSFGQAKKMVLTVKLPNAMRSVLRLLCQRKLYRQIDRYQIGNWILIGGRAVEALHNEAFAG